MKIYHHWVGPSDPINNYTISNQYIFNNKYIKDFKSWADEKSCACGKPVIFSKELIANGQIGIIIPFLGNKHFPIIEKDENFYIVNFFGIEYHQLYKVEFLGSLFYTSFPFSKLLDALNRNNEEIIYK